MTIWTTLLISPLLFATASSGAAQAADNGIPGAGGKTAAELLISQGAAEARKAEAEAERAELRARLPPSKSAVLAGSVDNRQFGAAGLVRAFGLARQLASEACAALPADRKTVIYDPGAAQGVVAARTVSDGFERLAGDLAKQNKQLQTYIDTHTPPGTKPSALPAIVLAAIPATVKAVADATSLFKTNVSVTGIGYGEGARELFATSLDEGCP